MEVGNYVITNDRLHIGKIDNINEFREPSMIYAIDFPNEDDFIFMGENDFKSSPNIIDLIEVGDYVNGLRVNEISEHTIFLDDMRDFSKKDINYVESIVTKEQFKSMKYRIGK